MGALSCTADNFAASLLSDFVLPLHDLKVTADIFLSALLTCSFNSHMARQASLVYETNEMSIASIDHSHLQLSSCKTGHPESIVSVQASVIGDPGSATFVPEGVVDAASGRVARDPEGAACSENTCHDRSVDVAQGFGNNTKDLWLFEDAKSTEDDSQVACLLSIVLIRGLIVA